MHEILFVRQISEIQKKALNKGSENLMNEAENPELSIAERIWKEI